jgi:hypothetical protein
VPKSEGQKQEEEQERQLQGQSQQKHPRLTMQLAEETEIAAEKMLRANVQRSLPLLKPTARNGGWGAAASPSEPLVVHEWATVWPNGCPSHYHWRCP